MAPPNIYLIDPKTKRHKENAVCLIEQCCNIIEGIEHQVAGFSIVAWDDSGRSGYMFKVGGPVSENAIASYVSSKINNFLERRLEDGTA